GIGLRTERPDRRPLHDPRAGRMLCSGNGVVHGRICTGIRARRTVERPFHVRGPLYHPGPSEDRPCTGDPETAHSLHTMTGFSVILGMLPVKQLTPAHGGVM